MLLSACSYHVSCDEPLSHVLLPNPSGFVHEVCLAWFYYHKHLRHPVYSCAAADARFQSTGLERAGPLATDIDNLTAEYSLQRPEPASDGPGNSYAKYVMLRTAWCPCSSHRLMC